MKNDPQCSNEQRNTVQMTAKPLKKWGDRWVLNPRPPVPQTLAPAPALLIQLGFADAPCPSGPESFRLCPVHLFTLNRGALV